MSSFQSLQNDRPTSQSIIHKITKMVSLSPLHTSFLLKLILNVVWIFSYEMCILMNVHILQLNTNKLNLSNLFNSKYMFLDYISWTTPPEPTEKKLIYQPGMALFHKGAPTLLLQMVHEYSFRSCHTIDVSLHSNTGYTLFLRMTKSNKVVIGKQVPLSGL